MDTQIKVAPYDEYNEILVGNACPPEWPNPVPDGRYNLLVIGGGSAGLVAAVGAAGANGAPGNSSTITGGASME